jgi:WD40 repeat protein
VDNVRATSRFYTAGGTLPPSSPSYVERHADQELLEALEAGQYCHVLTPRQMGKSSLMARTSAALKGRGWRTAIVDLTMLGKEGAVNAEQWYHGIARLVCRGLGVNLELSEWWTQRNLSPPAQRMIELWDEVVLEQINGHIAIFVDEIDATIGLSFSDDFFSALRACYNRRATDQRFERLSFVLLGVASPSQLIKDSTRTPFNIGQRIALSDFTPQEAQHLARGLPGDQAQQVSLLQLILRWTGGHPYLTQRLCQRVADVPGATPADVDFAVEELFTGERASREEINLTTIRDQLRMHRRARSLLKLYAQIRSDRPIQYQPLSPFHSALKLIGIVKQAESGPLEVRNEIYRKVFTSEWASKAAPSELPRVMLMGSVVILLVSLAGWYWLLLPRQDVDELRQAREDVPLAAYKALHALPGHAARADGLMAEYWDRSSLRASTRNRDLALALKMVALSYEDVERRRAEAAELVSDDYLDLVHTFRHRGALTAVAFSPDGKLVATASVDKTAQVWSVETGKPVGAPLRHGAVVNHVVFSSDGKFIATASMDNTAQIWEAQSGAAYGMPLLHDRPVSYVAFSPDGKLVATASVDKTARVWIVATSKRLGVPLQHGDLVNQVAFSPDGKLVATASVDKTARIWLAGSGSPVGPPLEHSNFVNRVIFSPDGKMLATASWDNTARVWAVNSGTPLIPPLHHAEGVNDIAFSPDGRLLATASLDNTARIWMVSNGRPVGAPLRHDEEVTQVVFSQSGEFVATASADKTARVWETRRGMPVTTPLRHDDRVSHLAFSPDAKLLVTASADATARIWRVGNGMSPVAPLHHTEGVTHAALSSDGKLVGTVGVDKSVRVWSVDGLNPQGAPLDHDDVVNHLAFSPDGKLVATASWDKTARVWSVGQGAPVGAPMRHDDFVSHVAFSPDSKLVATASLDNTARVWVADSGTAVGLEMRHDNAVNDVAFSPNGKLLATASADKSARLWIARTGAPVGSPIRHDSRVTQVVFSPDGEQILTASVDKVVRVWKVGTGKPVGARVMVHDSHAVPQFSPDGDEIVTCRGPWLYRWQVGSGALVQARLLPGTAIVALRITDLPDKVQVVTSFGDGLLPTAIDLSAPGSGALTGAPSQLLQRWGERLALPTQSDGYPDVLAQMRSPDSLEKSWSVR